MKAGSAGPISARADENDPRATLTIRARRCYVPRMRALVCLAFACLAGTRAAADVTPANVATLVTRWEVTGGAVSGGPILRNGRLHVGTWDGLVSALDPQTGATIWSTTVGGAVTGRVLVLDDGGVCYGTFA